MFVVIFTLLILALAACFGSKEAPITMPAGAQAGDLVDLEPCTFTSFEEEYAADLFHTAFNVWPFILLTNAIPGEPLPAFDTTLFTVNAAIVALAGVILMIATGGRLSYTADAHTHIIRGEQ
jgi:hypothetical protein